MRDHFVLHAGRLNTCDKIEGRDSHGSLIPKGKNEVVKQTTVVSARAGT